MKTAAIAFAAVGLLAAGAASASERVSDVDYMRAARCKGIATSLGSDTTSLEAFLKEQGLSRISYVLDRGQVEMSRGMRQAAKAGSRDRASAELSGPCRAYMGQSKTMAATPSPNS